MGKAALVAFYGDRIPVPLRRAVSSLHEELTAAWGTAFHPRPLPTIHSTVIGLEQGSPDDFARHLMDQLEREPVHLQFGGFAEREYELVSRGAPLFDRTLVHDAGKVVLVGWPVDDGRPSDRLDLLRRQAESFGLRHRYPLPDPDAHLVIGEVRGAVDVDATLHELRTRLADGGCVVPLRLDDLGIVEYDDPRLPLGTTTWTPLTPSGRSAGSQSGTS